VNVTGGRTSPIQLQSRFGRRAADWFSLDLPVDAAHPMSLVVTYNSEEREARRFDVQVDGRKVGEESFARRSPQEAGGFFDVVYRIPPDLVTGRQKVTVRFQAAAGSEVAGVFGVRMIRADEKPWSPVPAVIPGPVARSERVPRARAASAIHRRRVRHRAACPPRCSGR